MAKSDLDDVIRDLNMRLHEHLLTMDDAIEIVNKIGLVFHTTLNSDGSPNIHLGMPQDGMLTKLQSEVELRKNMGSIGNEPKETLPLPTRGKG